MVLHVAKLSPWSRCEKVRLLPLSWDKEQISDYLIPKLLYLLQRYQLVYFTKYWRCRLASDHPSFEASFVEVQPFILYDKVGQDIPEYQWIVHQSLDSLWLYQFWVIYIFCVLDLEQLH